MGWKKRRSRWGMPADRKEPFGARLSGTLILVNICIWIGLRHIDILVISGISAVLALIGFISGYRSLKRIVRRGGRIGGEGIARIGYYGNMICLILFLLIFAYSFAQGFLRGDFT